MSKKSVSGKGQSNTGDFCPVTCTMKELEKRIRETKKSDYGLSKFLEGVRHCRIIMAAATGGAVS
ncbi:hypothetical protein GALL_118200 [mine drainage metagenome]|jgi:hypothetical protein|uniref:Uncharacterized protein n=1 Tax=mine drainage metagenome TaxID=410659 RepID=A0A1J5SCD8_9ZZZZ